ncbi:MAG: acetyl-CoA hydrolase/transferase C-terminal domain-containing protein [Anaerolineae bacterium]|jgi:acyl-CoA hydrolase|nr:acetyl-CoA hydrolase/transferase C-terminal domain-containing protein [Anaerolineae bacterium]
MENQKLYQQKKISLGEAVKLVKSHQTVGVGIAGSEPAGLLTTMASRQDLPEDIHFWTCLPMRVYDIFIKPEMGGHIFNENWFYSGTDRKVHPEGRVSYTPNNLHRAATDKLRATNGHLDVFWGTATPPNADGYMSLSIGLIVQKDLLEAADLKILEINENLPWTYGDTLVHISEVDYVVENHIPLVELPEVPPTEIEQKIGGYIAELIEDGATLQLGIGGIPNAIAAFLSDRKDLGIHTEMIVDGMVDLFNAGIVNNSRKTLHPGKMIGAFALGTKKLYEFLDHNEAVEMYRGRYTNDPYVIAKNNKMISVNTALQVDIIGQVCSQSIGTRQFSGTGGQLDTHRGAQMSEGGRGIIALRSTAKNGSLSTIVPTLAPGAGVTVPSQDVDTIITEYGVAELRGRSVKDRMEALVRISHPNFREWIMEEAHRLGIVPKTVF